MDQDSGNVTVRMPVKIQKKLEKIAAGVNRSRNWLINQAIENYLEVYDWQEKRIRERLKKGEKGGKFYTTGQVNDAIESCKP